MKTIVYDRLKEILHHDRLPNGLDVYVLPKPGFHKTYATFATRYGSVDNHFAPPGKEPIQVPDGIAHFLEHKMFEEEDGDIFLRFSSLGASANAYTTFERTTYLFSCTGNVEENLTTLLDFVQRPYFTDQNVEKEKGIIAQEIRMYDDNPEWRAYFGLLQGLYHRHPVRTEIAGTVESIMTITKELLYLCYETFYHPSNMALFVVGPVDPARILSLVAENQAGKTFAPPGAIRRFYPEEPTNARQARVEIALPVGVPKCLFGFKDPAGGVSGDALLKRELATQLLYDIVLGPGSDLYQKLYDEGLIDDTFGVEVSVETTYSFSLAGGDTPDPDRMLDEVRKGLEAVVRSGISVTDFERARRKRLGEFLAHLNAPEFIANQFTKYRFQETDLFRTVALLESLTADDVNARMAEHWDFARFSACIVRSPQGKEATAKEGGA